jgi:hypothetical protein
MSQLKVPYTTPKLPPARRRALHEAGHAVVAHHYGIEVHSVSMSAKGSHAFASKFQRIEDYCRLQLGQPVDLAKIDRYLVFLMAGSVSEMLGIEKHHGVVARSPGQMQFRRQWSAQVWLNPDRHLDLAYFTIVAWSAARWGFDFEKQRRALWERTCKLVQTPAMWSRIERVAALLFEGRVLTAKEIADCGGPRE